MSRKTRLAAVGAALATGLTLPTLPPSASAATPEEIMAWCENASVIDGKQQQAKGGFADGFSADACDYEQVGDLEFFDGPTQQVAPRVRNCPPDVTNNLTQKLTWTVSVTQVSGKYEATRQGARYQILGQLLNGWWLRHKSTTDLTYDKVTATSTHEFTIPPGKILTVYWTPKMQRMTGKWVVTRGVDIYEAPEATEGPEMLAPAAGGKGMPNGNTDPVFEDCPS